MDCPHCEVEVKKVAGLKKHERVPVQRRYQGGIVTRYYGMTALQEPIPDGAMRIDECKSCHWKSIWRHDGERIEHSKGVSVTWRLITSGMGINEKEHLKKYGFKK